MIGDSKPRWRVTILIQRVISLLKCYTKGHHYVPMHYQRGGKVQYECDICGKPTEWMHKRQHHEFCITFVPTWGERGSDSQGYKKMSKLRMPPKERTIGEPEGGWKAGTYLVRVAFSQGNPIHNAIMHAPFLDEYRGDVRNEVLWCPNWEREYRVKDVHYLEVVRRSDELTAFL